jgi:xanthine dehydrogenase/oxidase
MLVCETIVEHVAAFLNKDPLVIRQLNIYVEGDITHFKQQLKPWHIPRMIDELIVSSELKKRQEEVEQFNATNACRKRGISLLPTKFGIGFEAIFLNQAGALVHIYKDGSVLLNHGGIVVVDAFVSYVPDTLQKNSLT